MHEIKLREGETYYRPADDFDELIALHIHNSLDRYIKLEFPTAANHRNYSMVSYGYAGRIPVATGHTIAIEPKVPIANLCRMLDVANDTRLVTLMDGEVEFSTLQGIVEYFALVLASRVTARCYQGLYRAYVPLSETSRKLRGRIDVVPSVLAWQRGSPQISCHHREHTADLEDNRILAWTLHLLSRMPMKNETAKRSVRRAYREISGKASTVEVDSSRLKGRTYHRLNHDYEIMHGLCRFFLEHLGPGLGVGESSFVPFLIDMDRLFERFVAQALHMSLPDHLVIEQQYVAPLTRERDHRYLIDLVIRDREGRVKCVLDTKYKGASKATSSDITQVVAYAARMRTHLAYLIYPSKVTMEREYHVGDVTVRSIVYDLDSDPEVALAQFLSKLSPAFQPI